MIDAWLTFAIIVSQKSTPGGSAMKSSNTVAELKAICATYDLDTSGKKADLIDRITEHGYPIPSHHNISRRKG